MPVSNSGLGYIFNQSEELISDIHIELGTTLVIQSSKIEIKCLLTLRFVSVSTDPDLLSQFLRPKRGRETLFHEIIFCAFLAGWGSPLGELAGKKSLAEDSI